MTSVSLLLIAINVYTVIDYVRDSFGDNLCTYAGLGIFGIFYMPMCLYLLLHVFISMGMDMRRHVTPDYGLVQEN